MPLIEIVSRPNIRSAYQAREYATKIRQIVRYLDISDADMEKGQMSVNLIYPYRRRVNGIQNNMILPIGNYNLNQK